MSSTGTKNNVKSGLSADDVVKILAACKESGVSRLVFSGLNVTMTPDPRTETIISQVPGLPSAETLQAMAELSEKGSVQDELSAKDRTLDELLIEDPLAYERLLREKELEDATNEDRRAE